MTISGIQFFRWKFRLVFPTCDFVIHLSFTSWCPLMPRAVQGSDQCKVRTASSVWEREAIYSFTPTCIQQATWRWGRDHFYFLNVKFLPSFLFSPSLPHSLPFFLLPSLSFSFSLSLPLSSSLYSSLPRLAVDAIRTFLLALKLYWALGEFTHQC